MKKKSLFVCLSMIGISLSGASQYYYNDIIAAQQSQQQYLALRKLKIKQFTATSLEVDGNTSPGFQLEQEISEDGRVVVTRSAIAINAQRITTNQYINNKLRKSLVNSKNIETKVDYLYDEMQRVQRITTNSIDTATRTNQLEVHEWLYNGKAPSEMRCIKNKTDTITVQFATDSLGLVTEENWYRKNKRTETWFYYYDTKGQLTDIVRYNARAKQLLPDYLFDYDEAGKIIEMRQAINSPGNYQIWTYEYNELGLKAKEVCYNKQKAYLGKIVYSYVKYNN